MVIVNNFPEATTLPSNIFIRVFFLRVRYKYVSHEDIIHRVQHLETSACMYRCFSSTFRLLSHTAYNILSRTPQISITYFLILKVPHVSF